MPLYFLRPRKYWLMLALAVTHSALWAQAETKTTASLETIKIFAHPDTNWLDFQPRSITGLKYAAQLQEIPQAVSVVDAELMLAQGSISLVDSLRYVPGVIGQYGDTDVRADWLMIRGFIPYKYLDGMRLPYGMGYGDSRIDAYFLERIEVLKGATSVLYGANTPTGLLNMSSKLPQARPYQEITLGTGTNNLQQARFDLGSTQEHDKLLWRVVGEGQKDGSQIDHVKEKRFTLAPSVRLQASDALNITVNGLWRHVNAPGGGSGTPWLPAEGTVLPNPNGKLATERFLGEPDYDRFKGKTQHLGYHVNYEPSQNWAFQHRLRYAQTDNQIWSVNQNFLGFYPDKRTVGRTIGQMHEKTSAWTSDNTLSGKLQTGRLHHHILLGLDWRKEKTRFDRWRGGQVADLDLYQPVYGKPYIRPVVMSRAELNTEQLGLYAQDQLRYSELLATLGLRYDKLDIRNPTDPKRLSTSTLTGRVALAWEARSGITPYISYSQGFEPVTGLDRNGRLFDPTRSEQYEVGVRYIPTNYNMMLSANIFESTQKNRLTPDPDRSLSNYCGYSCQVQYGKAKIKGLELEAQAELNSDLNVTASYSYTDARISASSNPLEIGTHLPDVPRHQAALWLDYSFKKQLNGLTLYGGVRYLSARPWLGLPNQQIPSYTLFDAGLRYKLEHLSTSLKGASLAVHAKNLGNKRYVSSCYGATVCYMGNQRNVVATLTYQW